MRRSSSVDDVKFPPASRLTALGVPSLHALSHHASLADLQGALTVQRVFPRALHLRHPSGWVVSVTEAEYNGPLGVRLPQNALAGLPVYPGARAWLGGGDLRIGSVVVSLAGSDPWTPPSSTSAPPLSLAALDRDIRRLSPHASIRADNLKPFLAALVRADRRAIAAEVNVWIGRGSGLTPAGDDLLVGLLTCLSVLGARLPDIHDWADEVRVVVARAIDGLDRKRTTALSRTLLLWAVRAVAVEPLLRVLYTVGVGGPIRELDALTAIGHSSGRDMLSGALLAFRSAAERGRIAGPALVRPT